MGHSDMDGDIRKLLTLLKKILRNHPQGSEHISKFMDQKSFDLNLCFLTFVPMTPEALMEFEEMYEAYLSRSEESSLGRETFKLEYKLSSDDLEFLKKNGIRF